MSCGSRLGRSKRVPLRKNQKGLPPGPRRLVRKGAKHGQPPSATMNDTALPEKQRKRAGGPSGAPPSAPVPSPDSFAVGYDFLLLNQDISDGTFPDVMGCVNRYRANKKVVLILVTYG